jgi:aldehyde dehydrogenase (NAD+)
LHTDLRRGRAEAYLTEVGYVTGEIRHTLKHLGGWMKPQSSFSPLAAAPSRSAVHHQPLGANLIIAPWNYPVQLALAPLIGAIAAGNTAIVKPSEIAPASSAAVREIVEVTFSPEFAAVVEGGVETSQALLAKPFDHIFFTGGTAVGRIVARAAAEHLARCTLELGGKSPAIVLDSADLDTAARRIVWGKFVNTGQTCIAPDYLLVHEAVHDGLLQRLGHAIDDFYGDDPRQSRDYGRIINDRHFDRLVRLIEPAKVVHGGKSDASERYIEPTLMHEVTLDDRVMQEEIFGPILPILKIRSLQDAIDVIGQRPDPLALYLFTKDPAEEKAIVDRVSFGGGCINNTLTHFIDPDLPFGGVGNSGGGAYHGRYSFEVFSHKKGVMKTGTFLDPGFKYPPYDDGKLKMLRRVVK